MTRMRAIAAQDGRTDVMRHAAALAAPSRCGRRHFEEEANMFLFPQV